jgi:hypothetical protein
LIALGQARIRMMMERGFSFFVGQRKRDPHLKTVQPRALRSLIGRGALRMGDAAPGRHPVDVAVTNRLLRAEAVTVDDLALEQVRHCRQADVRMRRHVEPLPHREPTIHLVEEGEGADHAARRRWKDATDSDSPEVAGARSDHVRDHGCRARARTERLDRRPDAHHYVVYVVCRRSDGECTSVSLAPAVDLNPRRSIS